MESVVSANDKQSLISSFLEIAVGQTTETAILFLQATSWQLDEAIHLFYVGNEGGAVASASQSPPGENADSRPDSRPDQDLINAGQNVGDEIRAPLPVVRDTLYDDAIFYRGSRAGYPPHEPSSLIAFRNFDEEMKRPGVWESDQGAPSTTDASRDNLASLYRPPFHLMFNGSFEKAKDAASLQDKWLLVNLQSTKEFSSHMLNRDTWANEAVSQMISTNFIFWQVYDDTSEGRKVCTYYKLESIPVVLVIDPITGQKMRSWCGMVHPESLLEDLVPFMDGGPRDQHATMSHKRPRGSSTTPQQKFKDKPDIESEELQQALVASMETIKDAIGASPPSDTNVTSTDKEETVTAEVPAYPPLPEEPKCDRNLLCRVGFRLPDGRRVQRNFFRTEPIQLLWSFCHSQLEGAETKAFRLTHAIPGATKPLDYDSKLTFEDSGLANAMITVTWE